MIALCLLLFANDWLVVPGERVGPIRASTTKSELVAMFGADAVRDAEINLGEGDHAPGTLIYPNDQTRSLAIVWESGYVKVCYGLDWYGKKKCRWKTEQGISIGTTLKDLEKLNGRPFKMAGFGWDYSGVVHSWEGGKLSGLLGKGGVCLMLGTRRGGRLTPEEGQMQGDGDYPSSDQALQKLNPRVYSMTVSIDKLTPARP